MEGSLWFRRFVKECRQLSPNLWFKRIKHGFYRIYWRGGGGQTAYMHEVYKWMPYRGYDIEERNMRFDSQTYYQEFEDTTDYNLKVKNYVEGYLDSIDTMRKRVRLFKNDKEFRKTATDAYKQIRVK